MRFGWIDIPNTWMEGERETFPSMASLAQAASPRLEKCTNPNPRDLPEFLSYIIRTAYKHSPFLRLIFSKRIIIFLLV